MYISLLEKRPQETLNSLLNYSTVNILKNNSWKNNIKNPNFKILIKIKIILKVQEEFHKGKNGRKYLNN